MKYFLILLCAFNIWLGMALFSNQALAGWMANADFSSCPRKYVSNTVGSEGPFNSESDCLARVRTVEREQNMACVRYSCTGQGAGTDGASSTEAGHQLDSHIGKAISAGISGDISPSSAVGLVGMGMIGNALLAPAAPQRQKTPAEIEADRVAAERAAIESARQERIRQEKKDAHVAPMFALLDPIPNANQPAKKPTLSNYYTKGFEHASQCISQNAGSACSGATAEQQQNCISDYRAGYDGGNRQKNLTMEEAFQAGLAAGSRGVLANGASNERATGPCRLEWIESYNRGHFDGKNRKPAK